MRIRPVTDFHIDLRRDGERERDVTNLTVAFRDFANESRMSF